jgi:cysteinyl-tRNA synthetase
MGMTDIDDKIIMKAKELKHSSWFETKKMVEYLEFQFLNDLDKLNVRRPNAILRATDHIPEIVSLIQNIESQGYAYPTKDGIFFNVEKFGDRYGKLCPIPPSRNDSDVESEGVSTDKKFWRDFALWKYQKNSDEQSWPSPWGDGRPGWHIECSAVINSYFGDHIDIHSGGVDLQFPHHTNEIAQRYD